MIGSPNGIYLNAENAILVTGFVVTLFYVESGLILFKN